MQQWMSHLWMCPTCGSSLINSAIRAWKCTPLKRLIRKLQKELWLFKSILPAVINPLQHYPLHLKELCHEHTIPRKFYHFYFKCKNIGKWRNCCHMLHAVCSMAWSLLLMGSVIFRFSFQWKGARIRAAMNNYQTKESARSSLGKWLHGVFGIYYWVSTFYPLQNLDIVYCN